MSAAISSGAGPCAPARSRACAAALVLLAAFALPLASSAQAAAAELNSPRQYLQLSLEASGPNHLRLSLSERTSRRLGSVRIRVRNHRLSRARLVRSRRSESFATAQGKRREHQLEANRLRVRLKGGRWLELLAADDGIAWRMRTGQDAAQLSLPGARVWTQTYRVNYEREYLPSRTERLARGEYGLPLLARKRGNWLLYSEAGVGPDYPASHLSRSSGRGSTLELKLARGSRGPVTPWRMLLMGSLARLVESSLPLALGQPRDESIDFSWVKPGRAAWSWWSLSSSPADENQQRRYVDFAARQGWEYVLVDAGWSEAWLPRLVEYARSQGVGILLWTHYNQLVDPAQREALLSLWASWGVAGIKADFFHSDARARMRDYHRILEATARHRLLVNLHGSTVPRGWQRTWPHLMTMEGVMGAEFYKGTSFSSRHNLTLPFTRNVIGSMDYTPVTLSAIRRQTSLAHELALSVVFESGLQHYADSPESYESHPVAAGWLAGVPAAWDDTRLLRGRPGRYVALARRSGRTWQVGVLASDLYSAADRSDELPLAWLRDHEGWAEQYRARLVYEIDGALQETEQLVSPSEKLRVPLQSKGGYVLRLEPVAPAPDPPAPVPAAAEPDR